MGSVNLIESIIKEYEDIKNVQVKGKFVEFELKSILYSILFDNEDLFPMIFVINDKECLPHFYLRDIEYRGQKYKKICLFDEGTIIEYIHTFEEKIRTSIEQLIRLAGLSKKEIIEEYQKEFLVYWNRACIEKYNYELYLDDDARFQWLDQYYTNENDVIRIACSDRFFNDKEKMKKEKIPALYIPIIDSRDIIPPIEGRPWTGKQINRIINSYDIQRISTESFNEIVSMSYSKKSILLVFKLNDLFFACIIEFKNAGTAKLSNKIEYEIEKVIPVKIQRCDFKYLNNRIGNNSSEKHVVIVGAGSLGSYISNELVHAGFRHLTIIDGDRYEAENTFRHSIRFNSFRLKKAMGMAFELKYIHPELEIEAINDYLSESDLDKYKICSADIIIFTVGNSDVQLRLNKALIKKNIQKPVYYVWLEHDGKTSHVAAMRDWHNGCFECLFTNKDGILGPNIINVANPSEIKYIKNGCGGTRIPYGNRTLLTASAALLSAISDDTESNCIYSFADDQFIKADFPKNERCRCCGI